MPTPAPSGSPLKKFLIHPSGSNASGNPIHSVASSSGPISQVALSQLRAELVQWRTNAVDRVATRDANSALVSERLANQKRAAEEEAKQRELDRRRKREEDERRDREQAQRTERERVERQKREEAEEKRRNDEFERKQKADEESKRVEDEKRREAAVRKARSATAASAAGAHAAEGRPALLTDESRSRASSTPDIQHVVKSEPTDDGDATMRDATPTKDVKPAIVVNGKAHDDSAASRKGTASVEPEASRTASPARDKSVDRKRKRDQMTAGSGVSSDSGEDQPLLQKVRKLGETTATTPQSSLGGRTAPATSVRPDMTRQVSTPALPDREERLRAAQRLLQEERFIKHSIPTKPPAPGSATAFYLPTSGLVPPEPLSIPPPPNAKKQSEVSDDFTKAKPGNQIAFNTFHTWVDAYLRPFGEDDLAFLASTPEDISPYQIPALGKHYLEQWEEEDSGGASSSAQHGTSIEPPPTQRLRPEALTEDSLGMENIYVGPLTERLVSAIAIQNKDATPFDVQKTSIGQVEDPTVEFPPPRTAVLDAVDLEERIRRELRFVGLLPEDEVDWNAREDDEITAALRQCQILLHRTTALNEGRKLKLQQLVNDRMAYQEYEAIRDAQERSIEAGWTKRSRTVKRKPKAKDNSGTTPGKPPVSLALLSAVEKRYQLVSHLKPFFEAEEVGRYFGIPQRSVYREVQPPPDDDGVSGLL